jgi:hypothetical protein
MILFYGDGAAAQAIAEEMKRDEDQKTADQVKKNQEEIATLAISQFEQMATAFGTALVTGEDGWKAFGKAGLSAIAAIVEALADKAAIEAAENLALVLEGDLTKIPAMLQNTAVVGLAYGAAAAIRAIPMAEGGSGKVTKPTLFLAGEAGPESYAFGGANDKAIGKTVVNNFHFNGSPWAIKEAENMVVGAMAKANRGY